MTREQILEDLARTLLTALEVAKARLDHEAKLSGDAFRNGAARTTCANAIELAKRIGVGT